MSAVHCVDIFCDTWFLDEETLECPTCGRSVEKLVEPEEEATDPEDGDGGEPIKEVVPEPEEVSDP